MKKNKTIFLFALLLTLSTLYQCGGSPEFIPIQIPIQKQDYLDTKDYAKIYYKPIQINLEKPIKDLYIEQIVSDYFLNSFSSIIEKKIQPLPSLNPQPNSLIIDGTITLEIMKRNVIKKIKVAGTKKNQFVKIENWKIDLKIAIISTKDQKILFEKTYTRNLEEAEPEDPIYNFKSIFSYCADQFSKDIFRKEKIEQRFLLF